VIAQIIKFGVGWDYWLLRALGPAQHSASGVVSVRLRACGTPAARSADEGWLPIGSSIQQRTLAGGECHYMPEVSVGEGDGQRLIIELPGGGPCAARGWRALTLALF
jgi:hypothetical protein